MPTTRRRRSRGRRPEEVRAWAGLFRFGCDYFSDLEAIGYAIPRDEEQAREDAAEAWRRLGAEFMADFTPTAERPRPWAFETFGPPPGWED